MSFVSVLKLNIFSFLLLRGKKKQFNKEGILSFLHIYKNPVAVVLKTCRFIFLDSSKTKRSPVKKKIKYLPVNIHAHFCQSQIDISPAPENK